QVVGLRPFGDAPYLRLAVGAPVRQEDEDLGIFRRSHGPWGLAVDVDGGNFGGGLSDGGVVACRLERGEHLAGDRRLTVTGRLVCACGGGGVDGRSDDQAQAYEGGYADDRPAGRVVHVRHSFS